MSHSRIPSLLRSCWTHGPKKQELENSLQKLESMETLTSYPAEPQQIFDEEVTILPAVQTSQYYPSFMTPNLFYRILFSALCLFQLQHPNQYVLNHLMVPTNLLKACLTSCLHVTNYKRDYNVADLNGFWSHMSGRYILEHLLQPFNLAGRLLDYTEDFKARNPGKPVFENFKEIVVEAMVTEILPNPAFQGISTFQKQVAQRTNEMINGKESVSNDTPTDLNGGEHSFIYQMAARHVAEENLNEWVAAWMAENPNTSLKRDWVTKIATILRKKFPVGGHLSDIEQNYFNSLTDEGKSSFLFSKLMEGDTEDRWVRFDMFVSQYPPLLADRDRVKAIVARAQLVPEAMVA